MKTVLRGGPRDGEIIETKKNDFAVGFVEERYEKVNGVEKFISSYEEKYHHTGYEKHPCKKKGMCCIYSYVGRFECEQHIPK